jgi:hypothetical protein
MNISDDFLHKILCARLGTQKRFIYEDSEPSLSLVLDYF